MKQIWRMLVLISALIILDQITKALILQHMQQGDIIPVINGFFNISHVRNEGAAFGFGSNFQDYTRIILFKILPVIACGWLVFLIWTTRENNKLQNVSYSLILSGAIGNLIDRFSYDYVVDFLDFYIGINHFPSFNVADSSITVGAFLLIIDIIIEMKQENNASNNS
jgi:signal peptidase II